MAAVRAVPVSVISAFQDDGLSFQLAEEAGFQTQGFTWWNPVPEGPEAGPWTPVPPGAGLWVPLDPSIIIPGTRR